MSARLRPSTRPDRPHRSLGLVTLLAAVLAVTGTGAVLPTTTSTASAEPGDPSPARQGPSLSRFAKVSAGGEYTCGIADAGSLWCWGRNTWGQTGNGERGMEVTDPEQVGGATTWRQVAAGGASTCGIRGDRDLLYCWGLNNRGQLGDETKETRTTPHKVPGHGWKSVDIGWYHACGIKDGGRMVCFGDNAYGELGLGNTRQSLQRRRVPGEWRSVAVDGWTTCGIKANRSLWCWGRNLLGQVGDASFTDRHRPVRIGRAGTRWSQVDVGWTSTCARRANGAVFCWGRNDRGGVGDGTTTIRNRPTRVLGDHQARSVAVFEAGACLVDTADHLYCWGDNRYGQVGGTAEISTRPRRRLGSYERVSGGWMHLCATGSSGVCWGSNERSQLGRSTRDPLPRRVVPSTTAVERRGPSYTFRIATFNVLGEHHSGPYRDADRFAPARMRAEWTAQAIQNNKLDVIGIQEPSEGQVSAILRASDGRLDAFPNPAEDKYSTESTLLWNKQRFEAVRTTVIRTMFIRRELPRPVVKLRDKVTGRGFWVMAIHNAGWDYQKQRNQAVREQIARINDLEERRTPVFYIGDFNEKKTVLCKVLRRTRMDSPIGGRLRDDGTCVAPRLMRVDWLFGSRSVDWGSFGFQKPPMVRLSTDHWVPMATVRVP